MECLEAVVDANILPWQINVKWSEDAPTLLGERGCFGRVSRTTRVETETTTKTTTTTTRTIVTTTIVTTTTVTTTIPP